MKFANALSFQLVWFLPPGKALPDAAQIYKTFAEVDAETVQTNKAPSPTAPFLQLAFGSHAGVQFRAIIQANRVDVAISENPGVAGNPLLPDSEGLHQRSIEGALRVSELIESSTRVSYVPKFAIEGADSFQADDLTADLIGVKRGASDLILQMNRRMKSRTSPGVEINRVLRWASEIVQHYMLNMQTGENALLPTMFWFATLQMDINTVPLERGLSSAHQKAVFKEIGEEVDRLRSSPSTSSLI